LKGNPNLDVQNNLLFENFSDANSYHSDDSDEDALLLVARTEQRPASPGSMFKNINKK